MTTEEQRTKAKRDLKPYWNENYTEVSSRLLSPIGIGSLASASISLNDSLPESLGRSWCSIKSIPLQSKSGISVLPSLSSYPVSTDCVVRRSRKILLKPSKEQKQILKNWKGAYRFVFNWVIDKKKEDYEVHGQSRSWQGARKEWIAELRQEYPWVDEIPTHTLYGAMKDADISYREIVRRWSQGSKSRIPRCSRKKQTSFFILGNAITRNGIYPRKLGRIRSAEPLPNKPSDGRIIHECGRWYLCYSEKVPVVYSESQGMCAVDPGVRTFATVFSTREVCKIGDNAFSRIVTLAKHLDNLLSRASKAPCRRKKRMLMAATRMRRKIKRLVDDLHYQTIGWLFRNYKTVAFSEGDFSDACKKVKRKIGRKSVRSLMTWAFARFRDRLIHKAKCLGGNVLIVNEAFTSKTANWTGQIVHNLGSRKTIHSNGITMDRDVNGSLGIYLRALLDQPIAVCRNSNCY